MNIDSNRKFTPPDGDGTRSLTWRERDGGVELLKVASGSFTATPSDPDATIARETWCIRHGLPVELAAVTSWVDDRMAEEENADE